jgi:hypothetical protein
VLLLGSLRGKPQNRFVVGSPFVVSGALVKRYDSTTFAGSSFRTRHAARPDVVAQAASPHTVLGTHAGVLRRLRSGPRRRSRLEGR